LHERRAVGVLMSVGTLLAWLAVGFFVYLFYIASTSRPRSSATVEPLPGNAAAVEFAINPQLLTDFAVSIDRDAPKGLVQLTMTGPAVSVSIRDCPIGAAQELQRQWTRRVRIVVRVEPAE
jgi:hypothetical protein